MESADLAALYDQISLPFMSLRSSALVLLIALPAAAVAGLITGAVGREASIKAGNGVDQVVGEATLAI